MLSDTKEKVIKVATLSLTIFLATCGSSGIMETQRAIGIQPTDSPSLFIHQGRPFTDPKFPIARRIQLVKVDFDILREITIPSDEPVAYKAYFNLFDDAAFNTTFHKVEYFQGRKGTVALDGTIDGDSGSSIVMVVTGVNMAATVTTGTHRMYRVLGYKDGLHRVGDTDPSGFGPD